VGNHGRPNFTQLTKHALQEQIGSATENVDHVNLEKAGIKPIRSGCKAALGMLIR